MPKIVTFSEPTQVIKREVVVEVPKSLVQHMRSQSANGSSKEEAMARDLARRAAFATFPTVGERILGLYDEHMPNWHDRRYPVMNERPCDHEENGIRAWRLV